ncbi:MAG: LamG-like jellyroll fold domain-containing protein [Verrucomicrobiota bacterium]
MSHRLPASSAFALAWLAALGTASALTYHIGYLEDEGKRAQITQVMDEAVAVYNATSNIDVDIRVIYHSGIPTAQANYNGELGFGGSISTQVAIHEIAHYLGSGTTGQWDGQFGGGNVWNGPALKRYVKLFNGPGAEIFRSGVHYFPYGFNYGNEDTPIDRYRIGRILRAMRMDMGGQDGDGDGMPDEWERYKSGSTALKVGGDTDGDGVSDFDEWWTDSHPTWVCPVKDGHIYQIRSRLSQKLMEVDGPTAGANVRQNPNIGSDLQKWVATNVGGGHWKFTNLLSGKALEVTGFSTDPSANVIVWNDTGGANQQWRIFPSASGAAYWKLGNRHSTNMVVDVDGGPNAIGDNTNIVQYFDDTNAFNQDWAFDDVTPDVLSDGLVANYKLEGNPRDYSGRNFHGTTIGGISYTAGRVGGLAATFNGSNGTIRVPATVERNFSLACWVKTTATAGTGQWYNGMGLIDADVGGVARDFGLAMVGDKAAFGVGNPEITITSANAINDGNWHHVAASFDTSNGAMKLYVDGVLSATGTGATIARSAPAHFHLGSSGGNVGFLNGSLDEARLYNKVLTQPEIERLANSSSALVANYSFDGNARDATLFGNQGDTFGSTYTPGKVGSQALQLSGTNSFAKLPAAVTRDFSVSYWVKTTAVGGTGQWWAGKSMVDADVPGIANDWGISVVGNRAAFGIGNTGEGTTILSTTNINDGNWHHIVATRVNTSGLMRLYVDGAQQAFGVGSTALRDAPGGIRVGSTLFGGSYLTGAIDELKIFDYAINANEVGALFATTPGEIWRQQHFLTTANSGDAADGADPDFDGTINLLERAFALNPKTPDAAAAQPVAANDGSFLTLTYQRSLAATDLEFQAQWSDDLASWFDTDITDSLISTGATTETREAKVPLGSLDPAHSFFRLRVR